MSTQSLYSLKVTHGENNISACREMEVMWEMDSPYVLKCSDISYQGWDVQFLVGYMDEGSLDKCNLQMT